MNTLRRIIRLPFLAVTFACALLAVALVPGCGGRYGGSGSGNPSSGTNDPTRQPQ